MCFFSCCSSFLSDSLLLFVGWLDASSLFRLCLPRSLLAIQPTSLKKKKINTKINVWNMQFSLRKIRFNYSPNGKANFVSCDLFIAMKTLLWNESAYFAFWKMNMSCTCACDDSLIKDTGEIDRETMKEAWFLINCVKKKAKRRAYRDARSIDECARARGE